MKDVEAPARPRVYCCEANAGQPMLGTAAVVDVWLLLEYRAAWRAKAWVDNDLDETVRAWLAQGIAALEAKGLQVRPQFVRQPEAHRADVRLLLHHEGVLRVFCADGGYEGLLRSPLEALLDGADGRLVAQPHYFVCTNGQRDRCCARFGLPAYHRLRELVGERAWQVTHLGGHRFAPNVLVLPQGRLYGRLHSQGGDDGPDAIAGFVAEMEAGRLALPYLRGRTCLPKPAQAAEGLVGSEGLVFVAMDGDERRASVTFAKGGERLQVAVARAETPARVLASCGDAALQEVWPYLLAE